MITSVFPPSSRRFVACILVAALALLGSACADRGTFLVVRIDGPSRPAIRSLSLMVKRSGRTARHIFEDAAGLVLPTSVSFDAASSIGPVEVAAKAYDKAGMLVAEDRATGAIKKGQVTELQLTLVSSTPTDASPDAGPDAGTDATPPRHRLTVTLTNEPGAFGVVQTNDKRIDCGLSCSAALPQGKVTLIARPVAGSDTRFEGWGPPCSDSVESRCTVTLHKDIVVEAYFSVFRANLIFISSERYPANLGRTAYDEKCNLLASAVGINNRSQNGFVAYMASPNPTTKVALDSARSLYRLDGDPVMSSLTLGARDRKVYNAIVFDEMGSEVGTTKLFTGLSPSGNAGLSCSDWTSNSGGAAATVGLSVGGPDLMLDSGETASCATRLPIICVGYRRTGFIGFQSPPSGSKRIFLSKAEYTPVPGNPSADAICQKEAKLSPMIGKAVALLSRSTTSPAVPLDPALKYYRPDNVLVGTGQELLDGDLRSGIWQYADTTYAAGDVLVWSGSKQPSAPPSENCREWRAVGSAAKALVGRAARLDSWWFAERKSCDTAARVYCVEQ